MRKHVEIIVPALALVLSFVFAPPSFATDPEGMVFVKKGDGGFYMDKYLVTQDDFQRVIGINRSRHHHCPTCPAEQLNLEEAINYCAKVGKALPNEEEWVYAATNGGKDDVWAGTSDLKELVDYAWYKENSGGKTHPVGEKKPNGLGLYDMSGNVWEWTTDEKFNGGSWDHDAVDLRAAYEGMYAIEGRYTYVGFRCVKR